ncbi:MAG TPA: leucine dehydrogenase [Bacteroidetes bacterium]|nr:leucine dehydrogenase [Bacteroidota bacterium]
MSVVKSKPEIDVPQEGIFSQIEGYEHEQVAFFNDKASGLRSIVAIHNTILGPSLGGTRFWNYNNEAEAVRDVLRLSRGMTFKAAAAGLNLGGGKAIIIGNSRTDKSEALFRRYGKFVNSLGGKYITAEDVGTNTQDMEWIALETKHVTGIPESMGGSGDPSPFTAYGTFLGIKASAKQMFGNDDLSGRKVAVQGIGHVGEVLVKHLIEAGAKVTVTDIHKDRIQHMVKTYGVSAVESDEIYDVDMDIYSPCALGATLNTENINRLKCHIVAGAANNQLADEKLHGNMLIEKGILYAPDFVINAGGLINVSCELEGYNRERVMDQTEKIYNRLLEIYTIAKEDNITTQEAAMQLAIKRLNDIASLNSRR